jgi:outer membrane protein assembly factor BamE
MRLVLITVLLLLAACVPYKMDIRQGNIVSPEMRETLKPGMTRMQVKMLLGSPLIEDPFRVDRWDYVYRLEHQKKLVERQRMTLYFTGDNLSRIDDSEMPALPVAVKPDEGAHESVTPENGKPEIGKEGK